MINVVGTQNEAQKYSEPLIFAQDWKDVSSYAVGAMTLAYSPKYQLLNYRVDSEGLRVIEAKNQQQEQNVQMVSI